MEQYFNGSFLRIRKMSDEVIAQISTKQASIKVLLHFSWNVSTEEVVGMDPGDVLRDILNTEDVADESDVDMFAASIAVEAWGSVSCQFAISHTQWNLRTQLDGRRSSYLRQNVCGSQVLHASTLHFTL
jgi:hypothetical protein